MKGLNYYLGFSWLNLGNKNVLNVKKTLVMMPDYCFPFREIFMLLVYLCKTVIWHNYNGVVHF